MNKAEKLRQALTTLEEAGILPKGEASRAVQRLTYGLGYSLVSLEQDSPLAPSVLALQAHKIDYDV